MILTIYAWIIEGFRDIQVLMAREQTWQVVYTKNLEKASYSCRK